MTAKEYLNKSRALDEQINNLLSNINYYRDLSTKITVAGGEPQGSGASDRLAGIVVKIVSLENELNSKIDELIAEQRKAQNKINQLTSANERKILLERYLHGKSWSLIAKEMGMTFQWVRCLHGRALKNFQSLDSN